MVLFIGIDEMIDDYVICFVWFDVCVIFDVFDQFGLLLLVIGFGLCVVKGCVLGLIIMVKFVVGKLFEGMMLCYFCIIVIDMVQFG